MEEDAIYATIKRLIIEIDEAMEEVCEDLNEHQSD